MSPQIPRDLSGLVFGLWTVISFDRVRGRERHFLCQCECGEVRSVGFSTLTGGKSKSCGCRRRLPYGAASRNAIYRTYERGAIRRGIRFELGSKQFASLTSKSCYYCGDPPSQSHHSLRTCSPYIYNGIDRINPIKGYITGNCVPCCGICNWMKGRLTRSKFLRQCRKIMKVQNGI